MLAINQVSIFDYGQHTKFHQCNNAKLTPAPQVNDE